MKLEGRVAIVTGASAGIGEAVAVALARRGARVTVTARREDRLAAVVGRIESGGGGAFAAPADIRDEAALRRVFAASHERWGRLDVLVNNAGLGLSAPLHGGPSASWRTMWEVNVHAVAVATSEALARFDPSEGGHVVNISSMAGHRVPPGGGFYAATKHAVRALTEALRQELRERRSRTRASAISPGYVETEFEAVLHGGTDRARAAHQQFRYLDPEDVATAVIHVLEAPDNVEINDVLLRPRDQLV